MPDFTLPQNADPAGPTLELLRRQAMVQAIQQRAAQQQDAQRAQWLQQQMGTPPVVTPATQSPMYGPGGRFVRG